MKTDTLLTHIVYPAWVKAALRGAATVCAVFGRAHASIDISKEVAAGSKRKQRRARRGPGKPVEVKAQTNLVVPPETLLPQSGFYWKVKRLDGLGIIAILLGVVGWNVDDILWLTVCIFLAAAAVCVIILTHIELKLIVRLVLSVVTLIVSYSILDYLKNRIDQRDLARNEGILYPGNLPMPHSRCQIAQNEVALFAGNNVHKGQHFNNTILMIGGEEIIGVEAAEGPALKLRVLRIFDDHDDIIARVDQNRIWLHPNARKSRPDRSTLIVYDHKDVQVLNLKFLNPRAIAVTGIFRARGMSTVVITDRGIEANGFTAAGDCIWNVRGPVFAF